LTAFFFPWPADMCLARWAFILKDRLHFEHLNDFFGMMSLRATGSRSEPTIPAWDWQQTLAAANQLPAASPSRQPAYFS